MEEEQRNNSRSKNRDPAHESYSPKLEELRSELPIAEFESLIVSTIKNNLFCIIIGETGSGKTTQIPQYVIDYISQEDINSSSAEVFAEFRLNNPQLEERETAPEIPRVEENVEDGRRENNQNTTQNNQNTTQNNQNSHRIGSRISLPPVLMECNKNLEIPEEEIDSESENKTPQGHLCSTISRPSTICVGLGIERTEEPMCESMPVVITKIHLVITQPRRVAAIQMCRRVSEERGIGIINSRDSLSVTDSPIGYTIRFEDRTSPNTLIKYATDGILVRECLSDPDLTRYNVVILDEAHERSLHTDILFALVKKAVIRRRGSLRLVVTSATLNERMFSKYFCKCPVLQVSGRCYPVSIFHGESPKEKRVENAVRSAIRIHLHEGGGDILVFLTGFEECEAAVRLSFTKLQELKERGKALAPILIIPLYGSQTTEQQAKAFQVTPPGARKVVFATNIAETSLTIDNIAFVVDTGYVKQKIYNAETGMESLEIIAISKVQATQRSGRAGRTCSGKCFRLYTRDFYENQMSPRTTPEIQRTNLASTVLTLKNMGISNILGFDFIEPPIREGILDALKQLYLLRALNKNGELTTLGIEMCKLPLEPSYAKALLTSNIFNCRREVTTLISLLSTEDIWQVVSKGDSSRRELFQDTKLKYAEKRSDHCSLLNVYEGWRRNGGSEKYANKHFLKCRALRHAQNIREQLEDTMRSINYSKCIKYIPKNRRYGRESPTWKRVSLSLAAGFFMKACRQLPNVGEGVYISIEEEHICKLDHMSNLSLCNYYPIWILYTEISGGRQGKGIIRLASEIKLSWIQDLLPLLKEVDFVKLSGGVVGGPEMDKENKVIQEERKHVSEEMGKIMGTGGKRASWEDKEKQEAERENKLALARNRFAKRKLVEQKKYKK